MDSNLTSSDIPLGLGMALAQNTEALKKFALLSEDQRKSLIEGAHNVNSRREMRNYVNNIIKM